MGSIWTNTGKSIQLRRSSITALIQTRRTCSLSVGSPAKKVSNISYARSNSWIALFAAAPDTPGMAEEMKTAVERAKAQRSGIIWIDEMVDQKTACELYSHV